MSMFCPNCGAQVPDNNKFCTSCGTKMVPPSASQGGPQQNSGWGAAPDSNWGAAPDNNWGAAQGYNRQAVPPAYPPAVPPNYGGRSRGPSYFDGTGGDLFVKQLLLGILSLITCSLATPWVLVNVLKWRKQHTVLDGKRLDFDGTAGELFGHWIKWFLLSIVTCGIYLYFAKIDYLKWEMKHTFYAGETPFRPTGEPASFFDGTVAEYVGTAILSGLITACSCGIAGAWGNTMVVQYETKGTCICGDRFSYSGTGGGLFGIYLVNGLLTLVTCGIYSAWATCAINRYVYENTHVDMMRRGF